MESADISIYQFFFKLNVLLIFENIGLVRIKLTEKLTILESYRQTLADLPENCIIRIDRFRLFLRFESCVR